MKSKDQSGNFIILAKDGAYPKVRESLLAHGLCVHKELPLVSGFVCDLGNFSAKQVADLDGVDWVGSDEVIRLACTGRKVKQEGVFGTVPWGVRRIGAPEFWETSQGQGVRVGVLDTGVDLTHPDLEGNLAEGVNLIDPDSPPGDDNGHGTHVSGTIAALQNRLGVVGVAPGATIVPIKAFDAEGESALSDLISGIDWALRNEILILNMSFGTGRSSLALARAVRIAYNRGLVMIAASGNDGGEANVDYPAWYPGVLAVGATDEEDGIAEFSSGGVGLDLVAPGVEIISTYLDGGYADLSGTSMACAHVSGAAALLMARDPGQDPDAIFDQIIRAAVPLSGIAAARQGAGLLDLTSLL